VQVSFWDSLCALGSLEQDTGQRSDTFRTAKEEATPFHAISAALTTIVRGSDTKPDGRVVAFQGGG